MSKATAESLINEQCQPEELMADGKLSRGPSLLPEGTCTPVVAANQSRPSKNVDLDPARLSDPDQCVAELNKQYAVVNSGSRVEIADEFNDTHPFLTVDAFHDLFANVMVLVDGKRLKPVTKYWFTHPDRRQYLAGTQFAPGVPASPNYYNLWKDFGVQADPLGSCPLFLNHVESVVCDGNQDCYEYLLNWLALAVQNPGVLPGVAICLLSGQGTGKGLFASYAGKLFGNHFKHITDRGQLFGRFTDHLDDALLMFADEMHWSGNKEETGLLKVLITEETRSSERKYGATMPVKNCVHLIIASNEGWVVPAELDDRRFFVLEVASKRVGDYGYFDQLSAEMDSGGPEALLHKLLTRDISTFNPKDFPRTQARVSQQLASLANIERWLYDLADSTQLSLDTGLIDAPWPAKLPKDQLYAAYCRWRSESRIAGPVESKAVFTQTLTKFGFTTGKATCPGKKNRVQAYVLPSVEGLRQVFDDKLKFTNDWPAL
ncbi:putative integrase [gamma proteobacterium NOR5-3]|nr:putative integrase [gamma proteobacterium NOR5-3]